MKHSTANLALLSVALTWGMSYPLMKIISTEMSSWSIITSRFLITVVLMLFFFRKKLKRPSRPLLIASGIGGTIVSLMIFLIICAVKIADASTVGFLISSSIAFVIIINIMLTRKLPKISVLMGLFAVIYGLYLLSGTGGLEFNLGALFALLAAVTYAIDIHFTNVFSPRFDSFNFGFWQMAAVLFFATVAQFFMGEGVVIPHSLTVIISLMLLAVICTFYCFSVQIAAQKYSSAQETGLIFTLEPVSSAFYSWLFLNENMSLRSFLGALIVLAGVIACMYFSNKRNTASKLIHANADNNQLS